MILQNIKFLRKFWIFIYIFIFYILLFTFYSYAQEKEQPVTINGDVVEFFEKENMVKGTGNVVVNFQDMKLTCDKAIAYLDSKEVEATGNVTLYQDESIFRADKLKYNFNTKKGKILKPSIEKVGPWYGKGEEADKVSEKEYKIRNGYITTCDLEKPHYRFQADNINIYLDKKIVAKNVFMYVGNVPILYFPYYVHSLDDNRPKVSFIPGHSKQWGYYLLSAWRYSLGKNSEGKIYLDYRELKGFASGFDHDYSLGKLGKGRLRVYYMDERDKVPPDNSPSFRERERYRIQLKHFARFDNGSLAFLEYNKMKDKDFIKDYFYEEEYQKDRQPKSYLSIIKHFSSNSLSFLLQKRINSFFTVTEYLPRLKFKMFRRKIRNTPLYYNGELSVSNLTNKKASSSQDDDVVRLDNYSSISIPKRFLNFININPYIATRQTYYSKNKFGEEDEMRSIFYAGIDTSVKFYKIYNLDTDFLNLDIHKLRHIITPTLNYKYIHSPTISSTNLMSFDSIDDISRKSTLTLGIENKFQTKRKSDNEMKTYQLGYFLLTSDYEFKPEDGSKWTTIKSDLEFTPFSWFRFEHDSEFDPQSRDFKSSNLDFIVNSSDKWGISLGHRYQKDTSSLLTTQFNYKLSKLWNFRTYMRYEYETKDLEEYELAVTRDLHCWLLDLVYNYDELANDHTIYIIFRLKAFPKIPFKVETSYHAPKSYE